MSTYRVTRTIAGGQFENDKCFTNWLESHEHSVLQLLDMRIDPISGIGDSSLASFYGDIDAWTVLAPPVYLAGKAIQEGAKGVADVAKVVPRRYYLWIQHVDVQTMKCPNSDPDLVNSGGKNGWATEAEARAVMNAQIGASEAIVAKVQASKAADNKVGNVAASAVKNLLTDAVEPLENLGKLPPWVGIVLVVGAAGGLYWLFRK